MWKELGVLVDVLLYVPQDFLQPRKPYYRHLLGAPLLEWYNKYTQNGLMMTAAKRSPTPERPKKNASFICMTYASHKCRD